MKIRFKKKGKAVYEKETKTPKPDTDAGKEELQSGDADIKKQKLTLDKIITLPAQSSLTGKEAKVKIIELDDTTVTFQYPDGQTEKYLKAVFEKKLKKEGTWSIGNSEEIEQFISAVNQLKDKYYDVVGDDTLFDYLDAAIKRVQQLAKTEFEKNK